MCRWRLSLFGCILFLGLFGASTLHAQPPTRSTTPGISSQTSRQRLQAPQLGRLLNTALTAHHPPGGQLLGKGRWLTLSTHIGDLGTITQAQNLAGLAAFILVAGVIGTIVGAGVLTTLGGNIYALTSGKSRLGWGAAGVVFGTLGVIITGVLMVPLIQSPDPTLATFTVISGLFSIGLLSMAIYNLVNHKQRRRRRDRDFPPPDSQFSPQDMAILPWATIDQQARATGGLALVGRF